MPPTVNSDYYEEPVEVTAHLALGRLLEGRGSIGNRTQTL